MSKLRYAGGGLDRASLRRAQPDWVLDQLEHNTSLVVPVSGTRNLFALEPSEGTFSHALLPRVSELRDHLDGDAEFVLLGLRETVAVFTLDLSTVEDEIITRRFAGEFADLRIAGACLSGPDASSLAYARGLLHWHRTHGFCGGCGRQTTSAHGGHMRSCLECAWEAFPRIDSAVIMLVETTNDAGEAICLLGRNARLPTGIFSTLGGFVETGESLEETVAREVMEEAGVRVDTVNYRGSQPWPFPASLMLGFRAHATTTEICRHDEELEEAYWFTASELSNFGEWSDDSATLRLPRHDSIARVLIDEWLGEQVGNAPTGC